jgi:hypothetical protein
VKPPASVGHHPLIIAPFRYQPLRSASPLTAQPAARAVLWGKEPGHSVGRAGLPHAAVAGMLTAAGRKGDPAPLNVVSHLDRSRAKLATSALPERASQALGRQLYQLDVEAFLVPSARAPSEFPCVCVYPSSVCQYPFRLTGLVP